MKKRKIHNSGEGGKQGFIRRKQAPHFKINIPILSV